MNSSPRPPSIAGDGCRIAPDRLLAEAASRDTSRFDYVIVGSGAGGGPLAARLALGGRRVLLIEAGGDPAKEKSTDFPRAEAGEIFRIPGYHAASTEDKELSWQYSVRHYASDERQKQDEKYNQAVSTFDDGVNPPAPSPPDPRFLDPGSRSGKGKGGVFYPRSSNIGGCTAHHAMIVVAPNDRDWNDIARLTGDESWRAGNMRGYFAALERNRYLGDYDNWFRNAFGLIYRGWRWLVLQFDPRAVLDQGGHGTAGWQPTSFIDPNLIENIARKDRAFLNVLARTALSVLHKDRPLVRAFKKALFQLRIVQQLDLNDINTRRVSPEGVFLIPTGIESEDATADGEQLRGRRVGVREFLLDTAARHPDRLVIRSCAHVTRVLFADQEDGRPPRAIGVEFAEGRHLYEASPLQSDAPPPTERGRYFAAHGGEVVLCGGAFNTPQLLMLSGIGDADALGGVALDPRYREPSLDPTPCVLRGADGEPLRDAEGRPLRVNLPGVGANLQDRYEVSVISQVSDDFSTLRGVSFSPGDPKDPARTQWLEKREGLYRTNGGSVALLRRSVALKPDEPEPDTFTFGAPAAFRGYYWGWSRELFRPKLGAADDQKNLWSWIILKAYTQNHAGRVRLRTQNPFHSPDICFDSFNEQAAADVARLGAEITKARDEGRCALALEEQLEAARARLADGERDLLALVDTIKSVREINARNSGQFVEEIQPGPDRPDDSEALKEWIKTQAWGHHCSCTCRIGADRWQADTSQLTDTGAVVDSRFRVHGVEGLRIVDASVFPKIPGYFILAPIFMVSEKAADVFLNERPGSAYYPREVEETEAESVRARREKAQRTAPATSPAGTASARSQDRLPADTVGLAFSGGGIRSATFALGFLQALAAKGRVRDVDLLSTVSGGGFTGSFLGRLFTRPFVSVAPDPVGRVQDTLKNTGSGPLWWLRTQANYIFATGRADYQQNLATFFRNLLSVHFIAGVLLFACMGLSAWLPGLLPFLDLPTVGGVDLSWWLLPTAAAFFFAVAPLVFAFWLTPYQGSYRAYSPFGFLSWGALLLGSAAALLFPGGAWVGLAGLVLLLLTLGWQEFVRIGLPLPAGRLAAAQATGSLVRNRITLALGEALMFFGVLLGWAVLDSLAATVARKENIPEGLAALMAVLAPALPFLRWIGTRASQQLVKKGTSGGMISVARLLGFPLAILLLFVLDVWAQRVAALSPVWGWGLWLIVTAFLFSLALGRAFPFLNLSSLQATYAARLTRTFQGASNEARVFNSAADGSRDVRTAHPGDDIAHDLYRPEDNGGPLHLINVCLNETVDLASEREIRERKGLPMCVSSTGVSVGRSYFTRWTPPDGFPRWQKIRRRIMGVDADDDTPLERRRKVALRPVRTSSNPYAFHVLASKLSESVEVESLSLGNWTAISGAAFTTGSGRSTSPAMSLFLGILNVRLGYWWDSGILAHERPGRYPHSLWRRIKRLPVALFRAQSLLFAEFRGRFRGASQWFWYLSDGGHFEVTGLYELVRRRVPLMIVTDAGADPDYLWGDLAELTRQARIDFGAQIEWLDPKNLPDDVPAWVRAWFDPAELGALESIKRVSEKHAALACVTYDSPAYPNEKCWLLLVKPGLSDATPADVRAYAATNTSFPQDPTIDQIFDDSQWESYRKLGQSIGTRLLRETP